MKKAIFISRHAPTPEQVDLMTSLGYGLMHVGDVDAFDLKGVESLIRANPSSLIVGVHPCISMVASMLGTDSGVFQNVMRPVEGGKPTFELGGVVMTTPPHHINEVFVHGEVKYFSV